MICLSSNRSIEIMLDKTRVDILIGIVEKEIEICNPYKEESKEDRVYMQELEGILSELKSVN